MSNGESILRTPWQPGSAAGWLLQQLKWCFSIKLGKMLQNEPASLEDAEVPYLKAQHVQWDRVRLSNLPRMWASLSEIESLEVAEGDLLVCEGGEVGRASTIVGKPPAHTVIQNALHLVRGSESGEPRFLMYLLRHAATQGWIEVLCNRATIAHFTVDKFGGMWASLPTLRMQRAIANYLDRETARLDALVAAKERVLELLVEKRQALIAHAVTRGLDPDVSLRDSGISWLGQIPAHWETKRAKWLFSERDTRSVTGEETLLSLRMERGLVPHNEVSEKQSRPEDLVGYKQTWPGDLVVNKMRAAIGLIAVSPQVGLVSPDYAVFVPPKSASVEYFNHLFTTNLMGTVFRSNSTGLGTGSSGFLRLYSEAFLALWLPYPPWVEQLAIVDFIEQETSKLDRLRAATQHTISLLKERRIALIAAAVTGQIDVEESS